MPHDRLEGRSLALHRAIAEKLRQHPELLAIARDNLDPRPLDAERRTLDSLLGAVEGNSQAAPEEILAAIVEDSPRMTELRQSAPFAGILDPKERWHIYDTFEPGTHHSGGGDPR